MKSMFLYFLMLGIMPILQGCDAPVVDGTSINNFVDSMKIVRDSLKVEKQDEFNESIKIILGSALMSSFQQAMSSGIANKNEDIYLSKFDGKNANQIIDEAKNILLIRKRNEKEQALIEIKELKVQKAEYLIAQEELKKFRVIKSQLLRKKSRNEYLEDQTIIDITVKNGTNQAISLVSFEGTLASPNRSVPWHKESFSYKISGGLEPAESANWWLEPNILSDWKKVNYPSDAIFTVVVTDLVGADGNSLYSLNSFTDKHMQRLKELQEEYVIADSNSNKSCICEKCTDDWDTERSDKWRHKKELYDSLKSSGYSTTNGFYSGLSIGNIKCGKNKQPLQVEHIVSVRETYNLGGCRWDDGKKKEFANDTDNLVLACARVNASKGASRPFDFKRKSNDKKGRDFSFADERWCKYLKKYYKVKKKYNLSFAENNPTTFKSCGLSLLE